MASTVTGATGSTGASTSSKKRPLPSGAEGPDSKRQKKRSKVDRLNAELKVAVGKLKTGLVDYQRSLLDRQVAKESVKAVYDHLIKMCNEILGGGDPNESVLAVFKIPFADMFELEEVLCERMDKHLIIIHNSVLSIITPLLSEVAERIEAVLTEKKGFPEPSAYARVATWRVWQKKSTAILNLRPPTNQGLPVEVLHPVFAAFINDITFMSLNKWAPGANANFASVDLCQAMACDFESETARRTKLKGLLRNFGLNIQTDFFIQGTLPQETHSTRVGLHLSAEDGRVVLLGEIQAEFESGDPYMQVSRSYQALVHNLESQGQASDGVPCILLAACGPLLTVAAGFFDGTHITVEPLAPPCTMVPCRYNHRERLLAHTLFYTRKAIRALLEPSTSKLSPSGTPRIYSTYLNSSEEHVDLEFIKPLGPSSLHLQPNPTLLFLAENPAEPANRLLVKLVAPECYGEAVHRTLAEEGLAPLLLGTACVAGAPSAIVMEYLDAPSGWTTLEKYIKEHQGLMITTEHPRLAELLETLKGKEVVHGDLRPNNIMCRERPDQGKEGGELEIKVVDFDWAGKLGDARYPAIMNPNIPWPGRPFEVIGEDDDKTLLSQTLARLYSRGN